MMKLLPGGKKYLEENMLYFYISALRRTNEKWPQYMKIGYRAWRTVCLLQMTIMGPAILMYLVNVEEKSLDVIAIPFIQMLLHICISMRMIYFIVYADESETIFERMNELFIHETRFAVKPQTMYNHVRWANRMTRAWILFAFFCTMCYPVPILIQKERAMPIPIWLPFDGLQTPYWHVIIVAETFGQIVLSVAYGNAEMYNVCVALLVARQFHLLSVDFENLFNHTLVECGYTPDEIVEFETTRLIGNHNSEELHKRIAATARTKQFALVFGKHFRTCVNHHQSLLIFMKMLQSFVSMELLMLLLFNYVYLTFTVFSFLKETDTFRCVTLLQYISGMVLQVVMVTVSGKDITNNSNKLREAVFNLPWYLCNNSVMGDFKYLLTRMTTEVAIQAGDVIPMTLETLLDFMKRCFSVLAVLRQMNK